MRMTAAVEDAAAMEGVAAVWETAAVEGVSSLP